VSDQSWNQKEEDLLAMVLRQQEERNQPNKSPLNRTSRGVSMNSEDIHARNLLHPSDATSAGRNRGSGLSSSRLGQRPIVDGNNNYVTPSRAYSSAMSSRAATAFSHSGNSVGWGTWLCGRSLASRLRAFRRFMRRWLLLVTIVAQGKGRHHKLLCLVCSCCSCCSCCTKVLHTTRPPVLVFFFPFLFSSLVQGCICFGCI
jgi:hypothetical protein